MAALAVLLLACQTSRQEPASAPTSASGAETRGARRAGPGSTPSSVSQAPFDPNAVQIRLEPVATGVREPTFVGAAYDGSGRLFAVEKAGRILILHGGQVSPQLFLDIRDQVGSRGSEQGLFSVAFHPRYLETGWFYVNYTDVNGNTRIERYTVSQDPDRADAASAALLFSIPQPAANHNGGYLLFGPDGYLYIGMGDGGGAGDQFRNAQNMSSLLGKMLRVDVDVDFPYAVPPDNPFLTTPGARPEIWAFGLRNPWRYAFDWSTGDLYIADVGQNQYEEVHFQPAGIGGQNYGWPMMEGGHCFPEPRPCDPTGLEIPVAEYPHAFGCSITGGLVYSGPRYREANGVYFYADFCSGRIWSLHWSDQSGWVQTELAQTPLRVSSIGEDEEGELYVVSLEPGSIHRMVLSRLPSGRGLSDVQTLSVAQSGHATG